MVFSASSVVVAARPRLLVLHRGPAAGMGVRHRPAARVRGVAALAADDPPIGGLLLLIVSVALLVLRTCPASASRSTATGTGSTSAAVPAPAVGVRQARAGRSGAPTCWPASGRLLGQWKHLLVPLLPVAAVRRGARRRAGRPRDGDRADRGRAGPAVGRRGAGPAVRPARSARRRRRVYFVLARRDRLERGHGCSWTRSPTSATGFQAGARRSTRWPPAAGGASGSAPAGRSGAALPEAHTDFIFAIIGEELGLLGTLAVLALFAVLGYAGLRIALDATGPVRPLRRRRDHRLGAGPGPGQHRVRCSGCCRSSGVPLPLVSYGGSALLPTCWSRSACCCRSPGRGARRRRAALRCGGTAGGRPRRSRRERRATVNVQCAVVLAGRRHGRPHRARPRARRRAAPPRPDGRGHRAGHRARAGDPAGPGARLRRWAHPAGAAAAPAEHSTCSRSPAGCAGAVAAAAAALRDRDADVVVGFGGYVALPAYLAARRLRMPDRRARGQRPARAGQPARRPADPPRRDVVPGHPAAARRARRHAAAARDRHPRPGRRRGPRRGERSG